jgi:hypothetical protein
VLSVGRLRRPRTRDPIAGGLFVVHALALLAAVECQREAPSAPLLDDR